MALLEIEKLAVISTAHVSEHTVSLLPEKAADLEHGRPDRPKHDWWPEFVRDEGWLFYLYGYQDEFDYNYQNAPKDLKDVLQYVRNSGCLWCLFDCDGRTIDGLYTYEW